VGHEEFEEAIPLYAAKTLEGPERQALEEHLRAGCPTCTALLREYEEVLAALAYEAPAQSLPADVREQILEAYRRERGLEPAAPRPPLGRERRRPVIALPALLQLWARPAFAMLLLMLLAGTVLYAWSLHKEIGRGVAQLQESNLVLTEERARLEALQRQLDEQTRLTLALREEHAHSQESPETLHQTLAQREAEVKRLQTALKEREQETARLKVEVARGREILDLFRSPNAMVVSLSGAEPAQSAAGLLLIDPKTNRGLFYGFNLPPLPPGKTYQLWAIRDKPISAGVFETDAGRKGRLVIKDIPNVGEVTKFAVSLEPEGGRPQPTGQIYLVGTI
jgi:hypothetical protein